MTSATTNTSTQAALYTTLNQDGDSTVSSGAKLYDFYDHPVTVRFDVASVSGQPGDKRNVFYFSIGDDAAGKYQPQSNALDDGIGFRLEQQGNPAAWIATALPTVPSSTSCFMRSRKRTSARRPRRSSSMGTSG